MSQNITLKIAGQEYPLKAENPEMERLMRLAAQDVNEMMAKFDARFPNTSIQDKLAFVALQEAVGKFSSRKSLADCKGEAKSLGEELDAYLKDVEKK